MVKTVDKKIIKITLIKFFSRNARCIITPTPIGTNKSDK